MLPPWTLSEGCMEAHVHSIFVCVFDIFHNEEFKFSNTCHTQIFLNAAYTWSHATFIRILVCSGLPVWQVNVCQCSFAQLDCKVLEDKDRFLCFLVSPQSPGNQKLVGISYIFLAGQPRDMEILEKIQLTSQRPLTPWQSFYWKQAGSSARSFFCWDLKVRGAVDGCKIRFY